MGDRDAASIRLGIFYDGGWFSHLWRYMEQHSHWQSSPSFAGVHDVLRWHLHRLYRCPLREVTVSCSHYVLGRPTDPGQRRATAQWDQILAYNGIVRHDARHAHGREQNADTLLAQITHAQAIAHSLDAVAVITGDSDLLPLVTRLTEAGFAVVVPSLPDTRYTDHTGRRWIRTSDKLTAAATHAPRWHDLLSTALRPDYPLSFPFIDPVPGVISKPAADGYRYGTVNRWHPDDGFGFITDRGGTRWYFDQVALSGQARPLPRWQPVRFTGNASPAHGRKYPQARTVQPYHPHRQGAEHDGR